MNDESATPDSHPLQFLIDEADRLRPIAESTEADELRAEGEKYQDAAAVKRANSQNADIGNELRRAAELLNRASNLEFERRQARQRLAEVDGLLAAAGDCESALRALREAQEKSSTLRQHVERVRTVVGEIDAELAGLQRERADAMATTTAEAVAARLEGRPRQSLPPDPHADRRVSLAAELEQAREALDAAADRLSRAEHGISEARTVYLEARYRRAKAEYTSALSIVAGYLADYAAASILAGFSRPEFKYRPDDEEIDAASAAIEREMSTSPVAL